MIAGTIHAACHKRWIYGEGYLSSVGEYFDVDLARLTRILKVIESSERPQIVLLQKHSPSGFARNACLVSSAWSTSYGALANPHWTVHRDFHYQCLFAAMAMLVDCGCERLRVGNLLCGEQWRRDAYLCLVEAVGNLRRLMRPDIEVFLEPRSHETAMVEEVDRTAGDFDMQEHRPIGINFHLLEGLNAAKIFIEPASGLTKLS